MRKNKLYQVICIASAMVFAFSMPAMAAESAEAEPAALDAEENVPVTLAASEADTDDTGDTSDFNGFHQKPGSDDWYYYVDGNVDTGLTDVVKGTVDGTSGWWNVINGKVTRAETVAKNSSGWWYIDANGMVDFDYTGFAKNNNGSWYCEKGKVTFQKQDIIKDSAGALGEKNAWYYVIDSQVQTGFTGLGNFRNTNGWWYITRGKVDFSHNGVDKNKNGWFYVTGGKVQADFTGLANYKNANGWWYIKNGKVDFNHNGVDKNKNGWFYVTGGKVQFGYTGLANYKNSNGWWYIKGGKVDFSATTVAKNKNGWWYVYNGKVLFDDALTYAAQFVGANTTTSQSNSSKLSTCYRVLWSTYPYVRTYGDNPSASVISKYAIDMFKNKKGNCYRYAASFACIAKVLGYNSRFAYGMISSASGGMTPHAWTEVYDNGQWLICDPDMQMNHPETNSYMRTESNYAYQHTCTGRFTLTVTASGAVWK